MENAEDINQLLIVSKLLLKIPKVSMNIHTGNINQKPLKSITCSNLLLETFSYSGKFRSITLSFQSSKMVKGSSSISIALCKPF